MVSPSIMIDYDYCTFFVNKMEKYPVGLPISHSLLVR